MRTETNPYEVVTADVMIKKWDNDVDLLFPQQFPPVHLARDGKPYCQLGGFNLRNWKQISTSVLRMNICGRCLIRKAARDRNEA